MRKPLAARFAFATAPLKLRIHCIEQNPLPDIVVVDDLTNTFETRALAKLNGHSVPKLSMLSPKRVIHRPESRTMNRKG
jgi:hypothetical protein